MNEAGEIWSECEKCGERVLWARDCASCGEKSQAAQVLAKQLEESIEDEMPDPLAAMRERLMKADRERRPRNTGR